MPAYVPTLRSEIAPLYLGRQGRLPPVVAIAGYFDDSHEGDIYAVAGYLGRVDVWDERFTPDWWGVLNRMPRRVSEFKASDCRHGVGEFLGWPQEERDSLTKQLVDLIVDRDTYPDLFGLGVAIVVPRHIATESLRVRYEGFAYCMCLGTLVMDALKVTHRLGEGDSLHLIFDRQRGLESKANVVFDEVLDTIRPETKASIRPLDFADSRDFPPLQAADLLAYETFKEMKNRQEIPSRATSTALQRLVAGRLHGATYYDAEMVLNLAQRMEPPPEKISFPWIYRQKIVRDRLAPGSD